MLLINLTYLTLRQISQLRKYNNITKYEGHEVHSNYTLQHLQITITVGNRNFLMNIKLHYE